MHHTVANGRPADSIIDLSVDPSVGFTDRAAARAEAIPWCVGLWQEDVCSIFPTSISFTGASWVDLDSLDAPSGFQGPVSGKPIHGSGTAAQMAPQVAILIHKICEHSRSQRNGRLYLPWATEGTVENDGTIGTTGVNFFNGVFDTFKDHLESNPFVTDADTAWRVVHVTGHSSDGTPNAWSSSDVTEVSTDIRTGTQRRRNRG
jgi:hypothetical protein